MDGTHPEKHKFACLQNVRRNPRSDRTDSLYTAPLLSSAPSGHAPRDVSGLRCAANSIICARFDGSDTWVRVLAPDVLVVSAHGPLLPALALLGAVSASRGSVLYVCHLALSGAVLDGQGRRMEGAGPGAAWGLRFIPLTERIISPSWAVFRGPTLCWSCSITSPSNFPGFAQSTLREIPSSRDFSQALAALMEKY